jgi:hypothetical protein
MDWPKQTALPEPKPSLLERFRARAPASSSRGKRLETPAPAELPVVAREHAPPDPVVWLRELETAIRTLPATAGAEAVAAREHTVTAVLGPLQNALELPPAERDLGMLALALERAEDILEALLLAQPDAPG